MTTTDAIAALLIADLTPLIAARNEPYEPIPDCATFRINYDIMRLATAEMTAALAIPADPKFRYYFSDSTYDELRNPATIIAECRDYFDYDYDNDFDALLTLIPQLADNINYLLMLDDDETANPETIDELAKLIADAAAA